MVAVLAGMFAFSVFPVQAEEQETMEKQMQTEMKEQEMIYGSQLMTQQEREEYRARIRAAETNEEREKIRAEHHERMSARAKEQGVMLPDEMPEQGMGRGMGPGGGMRPGGGGGR